MPSFIPSKSFTELGLRKSQTVTIVSLYHLLKRILSIFSGEEEGQAEDVRHFCNLITEKEWEVEEQPLMDANVTGNHFTNQLVGHNLVINIDRLI